MAENAKHTPGPWHVSSELDESCTVLSPDGETIAVTLDLDDYWRDAHDPESNNDPARMHAWQRECEANASLIAYAPDLLAACEAARQALSDRFEGPDAPYTPWALETLRVLDAAIDAARGEVSNG